MCASLSISLCSCDSFCSLFLSCSLCFHMLAQARCASSRRTVYHKIGQRTGNFQLNYSKRSDLFICTTNNRSMTTYGTLAENFPASARTEIQCVCVCSIQLKWVRACVCASVSCWFEFVVRLPNGFLPFDDAFHYIWLEMKRANSREIHIAKWTDQGYKLFSLKRRNWHETGSSFAIILRCVHVSAWTIASHFALTTKLWRMRSDRCCVVATEISIGHANHSNCSVTNALMPMLKRVTDKCDLWRSHNGMRAIQQTAVQPLCRTHARSQRRRSS